MRVAIPSILVVLVLAVLPLRAQLSSLAGEWRGRIVVPGGGLDVVLSIQQGGDGLAGTIDIPEQGARALPLVGFSSVGDTLLFTIRDVPGDPTFHGRFSNAADSLAGAFVQGGVPMPFALERTAATADSTVERLRAELSRILEDSRVPGMAVAVVHKGRVLIRQGFGLRDRTRALGVTDTTGFPIGSCTKAFTATLLGTLVDEGRLDWDTPVRNYLPDFQLYDGYATSHITPRDLLSHVSGLPRYDLLWYGNSDLTRADLYDRLRYLEPTADLRQEWQYQNMMVMVAGYMAERLLDTSWEDAVHNRILRPLGMSHTTLSIEAMRADSNASFGYERRRDSIFLLPYFTATSIGPAGTINSCARDMARWLLMNLNGGVVDGQRVLSEGTLREIQRPQVVIDGGGEDGGTEQVFDLYTLGWGVHTWRGHKMMEHGGNIDGFTAQIGLIPGEGIGVAILSNGDASEMPTVAMRTVFDRLLGNNEKDWGGEMARRIRAADAQSAAMSEEGEEDEEGGMRVLGTSPSHQLDEYAGFYEHPAFGTVEIEREGCTLRLHYGRVDTQLEHFHYDVFRTRADDAASEWFDHVRLNFRSDVNGRIEGFEARLETTASPVFFERRPPPAMSDTVQLERYAGRYSLSGRIVTVRRVSGHLLMNVPGQPEYTLDPLEVDLFELRDLDGFQVHFDMKRNRAVSVTFLQPSGTFVAKRVESEE